MHNSKDFVGHCNRIQCLKFSPLKEEILYSGGWDNTVNVYDMRVEGPVMAILGPQISGEAIDVRSDGILLTGSYSPADCL